VSEEQDLHSDKNTTSRFRGTKGFFYSPRQVVNSGMLHCFPKMFSFQTLFISLRTNISDTSDLAET